MRHASPGVQGGERDMKTLFEVKETGACWCSDNGKSVIVVWPCDLAHSSTQSGVEAAAAMTRSSSRQLRYFKNTQRPIAAIYVKKLTSSQSHDADVKYEHTFLDSVRLTLFFICHIYIIILE